MYVTQKNNFLYDICIVSRGSEGRSPSGVWGSAQELHTKLNPNWGFKHKSSKSIYTLNRPPDVFPDAVFNAKKYFYILMSV